MKKRIQFSGRYHAGLREYVLHGSGASLHLARTLGAEAVALELDTLELARIHEISLVSPVAPTPAPQQDKVSMARASLFFAEALGPIEQTHRGAREANIHLSQIVKSLSQRTVELADSVAALRASERMAGDLLESSLQMQAQLRDLSHQLLSAQEEERRKISRELHDVIAQTLTGINLRLATMKAAAEVGCEEFQEHIANTQQLVAESVDVVHRFARDLRPTMLDDLGLIPALNAFMTGFAETTGLRANLVAFAGIEDADCVVRTVLFRIAQEALNNVARHAGATCADVFIRDTGDGIAMEITDDGHGFQLNGNSCATKKGRLGLLGMRERIEMIGGTFSIESSVGNPTTVRVCIPIFSKPKTADFKCP